MTPAVRKMIGAAIVFACTFAGIATGEFLANRVYPGPEGDDQVPMPDDESMKID